MKILFVMPKVGAWATHGIHRSPNQLYAHWAAYVRERGYADVTVLDGKADQIPMEQLVEQVKAKNPDIVLRGKLPKTLRHHFHCCGTGNTGIDTGIDKALFEPFGEHRMQS